MTGLVRKATLMGVCGLLATATAFANVPSPGNSDNPDWVKVVATTSTGLVQPGEAIGGIVRDFSNNPIANVNVVIDFGGCSDIRLCNAVIAGAGTVTCGPSKVTVQTNAAGVWSVTIIGGANSTGNGLGSGANCATITVGGVPFPPATAYVTNMDGVLAGNPVTDPTKQPVNGFDLATYKADWIKVFVNGFPYLGRISHNQDPAHVIAGADLAAFKAHYNAVQSPSSGCTVGGVQQVYCP